jgi:hypothetical protein
MPARVLSLFGAALVALSVFAAPAFASLGDEVSAGQAVANELQSGKATCRSLSATQFEHLGEYVMDRMAGSRAAHEAMNARMEQAIGAENTDRMHELMGRRFAGCAAGTASSAPMGPGMMGGGSANGGGWGMMSSAGWGWMRDGTWQHMSQRQWRHLAGTMMGSRYVTPGSGGWSPAAVVAAILGALLIGAAIVVLVTRRPWRRRPPTASSPA